MHSAVLSWVTEADEQQTVQSKHRGEQSFETFNLCVVQAPAFRSCCKWTMKGDATSEPGTRSCLSHWFGRVQENLFLQSVTRLQMWCTASILVDCRTVSRCTIKCGLIDVRKKSAPFATRLPQTSQIHSELL